MSLKFRKVAQTKADAALGLSLKCSSLEPSYVNIVFKQK